jgi:hypothetical protein
VRKRLRSALRYVALVIILTLLAVPLMSAFTQVAEQSPRIGKIRGHGQVGQEEISVIADFDSALNAHNPEAALALFSDGAVVSDLSNIACLSGSGWIVPPPCGGQFVFTTAAQIRGWLEQLVKEGIQVKEIGNYRVMAANVTWDLEVTVDEYRLLDVAPLVANAMAVVQDWKIKSLTISLDQESTKKLALGYASHQRTPYSILAGGVGFGILVLGLVFPAAAAYYISRVKDLFATVPGLKRPWILLQAGVVSLFIAILLVAIRITVRAPPSSLDTIRCVVVVLTGSFFLAAMLLMKRVWLVAPND